MRILNEFKLLTRDQKIWYWFARLKLFAKTDKILFKHKLNTTCYIFVKVYVVAEIGA